MKILNTLKTPWFHQKLTTEKTKMKETSKSVIVQLGEWSPTLPPSKLKK